MHSYVWCNGKIEKNKSLLFTFTIPYIDKIFEHIFLCDKHTPFAFPVVPDVNSNIFNSSGSIVIFSNLLFPSSTRFFPFSTWISNDNKFFPCILLSKSINNVSLFSSFSIFSTIFFKFLLSPKIHLLSETFIKFITSSECNSLSIGTTIPTIDAAKYDIAHLYEFFPITAIFLFNIPLFIRAVPKLTTSSLYFE